MVRIGTCSVCRITAPVWGEDQPGCVAHLDAGETERVGGRLTPAQVAALRADRARGLSWSTLGRKYGLHPANARRCALELSYRGEAA